MEVLSKYLHSTDQNEVLVALSRFRTLLSSGISIIMHITFELRPRTSEKLSLEILLGNRKTVHCPRLHFS